MPDFKKIPRGVLIFGIVLISSSLIQMADWLTPRYWRYYRDIFQPLPEQLISLRYIISGLRRISGLILGTGIFLRRDVFRKLFIAFSWLTLFTLYWKHPVFALQNHAGFILNKMSGVTGSCGFIALPSETALTAMSLAGLYLIDIVFSLLAIYYFRQPAIKEWFKFD